MTASTPARLAALLLAAEGAALTVLAAWELVALVSGDTTSVESSIALFALTLVGAAALVAFAVAVWRGHSWGRSGGIVAQLLLASVALGMLTGPGARPQVALVLAVPAVAGFVLLIAAVRRAGADARAASADAEDAP
ncbi:hypothetical protein [Microbacterium sp. No. 7]|uniref:hypothetical protein n=1 Tax=Microbacterium sp. No. 7 TaxID=1714373 RepID=UPI0006D062B2|nr:hypothetical protein [Microbacterium sp. No. 7]ALJ21258.1 histidine kinase [Microbacterium sp. No. 7]